MGRGFRTLLAIVEVLQPAFTRPGFRNAWVVFAGWVRTAGPHAVTQALVVTDVARRLHHERFHRFFSRGTWCPDAVGQQLVGLLVARLAPTGRLCVALDDPLVPKKGPAVFGLGCHLDAVRSTKRCRVFAFGHVWVIVALVVRVPFAARRWACPVLFRLYRTKRECQRTGARYRKKTELGRELVDLVASWVPAQSLDVVVDAAYCNATLTRGLPARVTVIGALRPDAVLTAAPPPAARPRPGRRRTRGAVLPKPAQVFDDPRWAWTTRELTLYRRATRVRYKTLTAQWYRGAGARLGRVVVVRVDDGAIRLRTFFCTDADRPAPDLLMAYAGRWAIEVCFKELKQQLGFADSSARKQAAVERTAPFVGYLYVVLVLWFADGIWQTAVAAPPIRPWYVHKRHASFADVLRAAQRVLGPVDVLVPARGFDNLPEIVTALRQPRRPARRHAA
jgi:DDE superfamily endonuclease